jgi:hypothetical protein
MQQGLAGVALVALFLAGGPAFSAPDEDPPPVQIPKTGMKSGRLTEKHDKGAEISGRDYKFHPKIEFGDDEERGIHWKDFKKGDDVQYHLTKEQIDLLIRILPK